MDVSKLISVIRQPDGSIVMRPFIIHIYGTLWLEHSLSNPDVAVPGSAPYANQRLDRWEGLDPFHLTLDGIGDVVSYRAVAVRYPGGTVGKFKLASPGWMFTIIPPQWGK